MPWPDRRFPHHSPRRGALESSEKQHDPDMRGQLEASPSPAAMPVNVGRPDSCADCLSGAPCYARFSFWFRARLHEQPLRAVTGTALGHGSWLHHLAAGPTMSTLCLSTSSSVSYGMIAAPSHGPVMEIKWINLQHTKNYIWHALRRPVFKTKGSSQDKGTWYQKDTYNFRNKEKHQKL